MTTTADTSEFEITRDWLGRNNKIFARGQINYLEERDTVGINLIDTPFYFPFLLREKLASKNVRLNGSVDTLSLPDSATHFFSFRRSLVEVLTDLNKESDNLNAEMTLRAMAYESEGIPASAEGGIVLIDSLIKIIGLEPDKFHLVDGSGVSHYNLVTAELMIEVLKHFYLNEKALFELLYESFPIGGVDGTLETRTVSYTHLRAHET